MTRRVSFLVRSASSSSAGAFVVEGECWPGPIQAGDRFQAAVSEAGTEELSVELAVLVVGDGRLELPSGKPGSLYLRGEASLEGLPARVLLGEVDRS